MLILFRKYKKQVHRKRAQDPLQIFDLLQLSRKEKQGREQSFASIQNFNRWKRKRILQEGLPANTFGRIEGVLLRRKAQESLHQYRMMRNVRIRAFANYMEKLPLRESLYRDSSV